ncbi:MAG: acyl-CoA thioesterase [Elusimicrobiota bacterium]
MRPKNILDIKIYYSDTDCGGVVYYANYLVYFEKARTEWMESRGAGVKDLSEKGVLFIVAGADLSYKRPARYGDVIRVKTRADKIGAARIVFSYRIFNKNTSELLVTGSTTLGCIDENMRPRRIPAEVAEKLRA